MPTKHKAIKDSPWKVTADRYVGFIDIMGFKNTVLRSTHEEIYAMMKRIENMKRTNESIEWDGNPDQFIQSTFYSDSIILYSKDDSGESAFAMTNTLSGLTNDLIQAAIPHKGALAFGKMTLDNDRSIFFGQPLIDAYLLQEELIMYGVVVHASAETEFENSSKGPVFLHDFLCPFRGGSSFHLTIPPMFAVTDEGGREKFLKHLRKFRAQTSGHIRRYIDNTEAYLKAL